MDSAMTANLEIEFSRPYFTLDSMTFDDPDGNGDGVLGLGETVDVIFNVKNQWADGNDVVAALSLDDDRLGLVVDTVSLGTIAGGSTFSNLGLPLKFSIPSDMDTVQVGVTVTLSYSNSDEEIVFTERANVGGSKILLVDDDAGADLEQYFRDPLDSLRITYDVWDKELLGTPGEIQKLHPMIFWFTGDSRSVTLSSSDIAFIKDFLEHGGGLFLNGQDIAEHLSVTDTAFLSQYLKCQYGGNLITQWQVDGQVGTELGGDGIKFVISGADGGADNQDSPDWIVPEDQELVNFKYWNSIHSCGLEIENGYHRIVFFSFGFEAINDVYERIHGYGSRKTMLTRIVSFLEGRPAMSNRPPGAFSLLFPADGDSIEGNRLNLVWHGTKDPDLLDPVTYTLLCSTSGTAPWLYDIEDLTDTVYTLDDLDYGTMYRWKVIATDSHGAETQSAMQAFYVMRDLVPPNFVLRLMPNPVIPFLLDVYAYPSEPLESEPRLKVESTVPTQQIDSLTMTLAVGRATTVYMADYRIEHVGSYNISVCGTDEWENYGCSVTDFSAAPLFVDRETVLESCSRIFRLSIEPHSVDGQGMLLVFEDESAAAGVDYSQLVSEFTPIVSLDLRASASELDRAGSLTIDLERLNVPREQVLSLAVVYVADGTARSVPIRYDRASGKLSADISRFGTYVIGKLDGENGDLITDGQLPPAFTLHQNSPNPFNPGTSISFDLPEPVHVNLAVYNILGQKVITLVDEHLNGGSHTISWNGRDSYGNAAASGIYFYRLQAEKFAETRRMVLLK